MLPNFSEVNNIPFLQDNTPVSIVRQELVNYPMNKGTFQMRSTRYNCPDHVQPTAY